MNGYLQYYNNKNFDCDDINYSENLIRVQRVNVFRKGGGVIMHNIIYFPVVEKAVSMHCRNWWMLDNSGWSWCLYSSIMESLDVLKFDVFYVFNRVRQVKFCLYGSYIVVRGSQNRCGLQVRVPSMFT